MERTRGLAVFWKKEEETMVRQEGNRLVIEEGAAKVVIECWGRIPCA